MKNQPGAAPGAGWVSPPSNYITIESVTLERPGGAVQQQQPMCVGGGTSGGKACICNADCFACEYDGTSNMVGPCSKCKNSKVLLAQGHCGDESDCDGDVVGKGKFGRFCRFKVATATAASAGRVVQQQQQHQQQQQQQPRGGGSTAAAEIQKLRVLRDQGVLSKDEFTAAKKKALGIYGTTTDRGVHP